VAAFPAKPNAVRQVIAESGSTSITLEWDTSAATQLPVIGYLLKADDGLGGAYTTVYDGRNFPNVLKNLVSGLKTARSYKFTI
jgi:hypothetical protein